MKFKLKPSDEYILLRTDEVAETSQGGIILSPGKKEDAVAVGEVLAVGPTAANPGEDKLAFKVGEMVYFNKFSGVPVAFIGKDFRLIRRGEVYGILEEETN